MTAFYICDAQKIFYIFNGNVVIALNNKNKKHSSVVPYYLLIKQLR